MQLFKLLELGNVYLLCESVSWRVGSFYCFRTRLFVSLRVSHDVEHGTLSSKSLSVSADIVRSKYYPHPMVNLLDFQPDAQHYHLLTTIGHGCRGAAIVSLARHTATGSLVAVKRINLDSIPIDFNLVQHEVLSHKQLSHENIISALCSFVHENEIWVVLPLMAYGSCRDLLHAHFIEGLPEQAIAYIMRAVLQALEYLHEKSLIHRYIKL